MMLLKDPFGYCQVKGEGRVETEGLVGRVFK